MEHQEEVPIISPTFLKKLLCHPKDKSLFFYTFGVVLHSPSSFFFPGCINSILSFILWLPNKTSNPRRNPLFDVEWASKVYSSDFHWQKAGQSPQLEQNESQLKAFVTRYISPVSWTLNLSKAANGSCTLNNFQNISHGLPEAATVEIQEPPEVAASCWQNSPVHAKKTPSYGRFYFSFPATLLALAEWTQQPWVSGRDSLLKRSEKSLKGREGNLCSLEWSLGPCERAGWKFSGMLSTAGITGRKSSEKNILLLSGLNLCFRERRSWWQGLFSQSCQDILLSDKRQNNFCLNFLVSKNTFNLSVRGGEERMLEQNIFSTATWKVILMNDNLLSIIIPKYKIGSVFYVIWNGVWSYWQGCWLPGGS